MTDLFDHTTVIRIRQREHIKYGISISSNEHMMSIFKTFFNLSVTDLLDYKSNVLQTTYCGFQPSPKWLQKKLGMINNSQALNYNSIKVSMDEGEMFEFNNHEYLFNIKESYLNLKLKDSFEHLNILRVHNRTLSSIRNMIKALSMDQLRKLTDGTTDGDSTYRIMYQDLIKIRHQ